MTATSPAPNLALPAPTPVWHLYRTLVGVAMVCGVLIVAAFDFTKPLIRRNKVEAKKQAVFLVLPGAAQVRTFRFGDGGGYAPVPDDSEGDGLAYAGFDAERRLVGVAVEVRGNGYQDEVRVLWGYSFEQQAIIGMRVLESRETPGLGDRVETDAGYLANFVKLDVALGADGSALAHPIEFVKQGQKQHPWQIDGITGATVTSKAIATMLSASTAAVVPRLQARRADFRSGSD
jgi:electron transport complex protein RnfG